MFKYVLMLLYAVANTLCLIGYALGDEIIRAHVTGGWFWLMVGAPLVFVGVLFARLLVNFLP